MKTLILKLPNTEEIISLTKDDSSKFWVSISPELKIEEDQNLGYSVIEIDAELDIAYGSEYLINIFIDQINEIKKKEIDDISHGVESENNDSSISETHITKPDFDPEQIRVDSKNFSVLDVVRFIDKKRIDLSPDFQRYFVWKDSVKQSRLIESLLLRIPLPVFYLSEDNEGLYQVVDGLQRLTTIDLFYKNKLKLKGLEYLEDCEGETFGTLKLKYQNRIEDTQLTFNIIAPTTPSSVKFEIFKRINEGGKPLNRQEIRNSMAKPNVRQLIQSLASSEGFINATDNSIKPIRMEDQELVMRFIAFYISNLEITESPYKGDMEFFLDDTLDYLNKNYSPELEGTLENSFKNAMENAYYLFGRYAFRKTTFEAYRDSRRSLINKSLFTVWSVLLSKIPPHVFHKTVNKGQMVEYFVSKITEDQAYFDSLTIGTNQANKLSYGFKIAESLINESLKISHD
ncbi:DUF262 domain-containing protein [uncultured Arcticibacterium sp.]|uniref:DUF262 domain-containing protein n=1 Tax=uncultured Arcticibacterium sp. TaxID=2173042 RepID=UPI0030FBE1EA